MLGYFLLWPNNAAGPILIVGSHFCISLYLFIYADSLQAWMADWCPAPEDRNVIVGVAVTFVYAIDSFANGTSMK